MKKISLTPLLLITTSVLATATTTVPTAPINPGAYNFTDSSARISFKDMSMDETGFRIEHVQAGNAVIATHTPEDTNLSDHYEYVNLTGLTPQTLYTVNIIAFNDNGDATPLTKSFRTLETPNTPAQPTTVGAYDFTNTSARISFLDNADNESGFKIYNNGAVIETLPANATTGEYNYTNLTGLTTCSLYTIDIVAFNGDGESEKSQKSFMTTGCMTAADIPVAPSNVGVYNITDETARVSFMDNANNEQVTDGFVIYNNDDNSTMATLPRDRYDHEYQYKNLTGLMADTLYTIRVVAKNAAGEGSAELKSFHTLP
ncbi:MAG: Unknown protein [uncultured Sulfurovum sp.]|uniref:Fibronectin type-III domain-containing protein n=1 Tax=uncultured Sulfurovum sp. TaxID=269237 RepID=A0A6S6TS04_9BACT|nr:MAG: Unknown protein [uncultured Sulfurovum sp.]